MSPETTDCSGARKNAGPSRAKSAPNTRNDKRWIRWSRHQRAVTNEKRGAADESRPTSRRNETQPRGATTGRDHETQSRTRPRDAATRRDQRAALVCQAKLAPSRRPPPAQGRAFARTRRPLVEGLGPAGRPARAGWRSPAGAPGPAAHAERARRATPVDRRVLGALALSRGGSAWRLAHALLRPRRAGPRRQRLQPAKCRPGRPARALAQRNQQGRSACAAARQPRSVRSRAVRPSSPASRAAAACRQVLCVGPWARHRGCRRSRAQSVWQQWQGRRSRAAAARPLSADAQARGPSRLLCRRLRYPLSS